MIKSKINLKKISRKKMSIIRPKSTTITIKKESNQARTTLHNPSTGVSFTLFHCLSLYIFWQELDARGRITSNRTKRNDFIRISLIRLE